MDQNQQELRHAAAQSFLQSLGQLEEALQPSEAAVVGDRPAESSQHPILPSPSNMEDLNLEALEAAAADIEQFIQQSNEFTK